MKLSLSTNWCNRRIERGEEIAAKAVALGFDELELGFHTTDLQARDFKRCLKMIPVGSVHAFCPVPLSAPQGYPELYQLASFDAEAVRMGVFQVKRNIRFAAEMGADALVLHAGRVSCASFFARFRASRRAARGRRLLDPFKRALDELLPELEAAGVRLGLENLPYPEGFPNADEIAHVTGEWVWPWFDTGHALIMGRKPDDRVLGIHLNDTHGQQDEHLAPGFGAVDFKALKPLAENARHVVFEPGNHVSEADLSQGLKFIKEIWK